MNPKVTQYINSAQIWKEELQAIREILLETELVEELKWATPCYTHNNKNIVILAPFKEYFALGFFNGSHLTDPKGLLIKPGEHTRFGRQLRLENTQDIVMTMSCVFSSLNCLPNLVCSPGLINKPLGSVK